MKKFKTTFRVRFMTDCRGMFIRIEEISAEIFAKNEEEAREILTEWLPDSNPDFGFDVDEIVKRVELVEEDTTRNQEGIFFSFTA